MKGAANTRTKIYFVVSTPQLLYFLVNFHFNFGLIYLNMKLLYHKQFTAKVNITF